MAAVPQKTLSWLYSVLGSYRDSQRTYNDLVQTLTQYPNLSPRTDVYNFENGSSALLVHLVGTIPVSFRGATYRFPIALWIPQGYPYEAPLAYVTPTEDMVVRPGQHVSAEGRVYHHYLAHWIETWQTSNTVEFLAILSAVFAREPPVIARQQGHARPPQPRPGPAGPPPIPPLPRDLQQSPPRSSSMSSTSTLPPPPPPKPSPQGTNGNSTPGSPHQSRYDAPPPLPSQPGRVNGFRSSSGSSYGGGPPLRPGQTQQEFPGRQSSLRHGFTQTQIPQPVLQGAPPPQQPPCTHPQYASHGQPLPQQPQPRGLPYPHQQPPDMALQHPPPPQGQQHPQQPYPQPQQPQYNPPKPKPQPAPNLLDSAFDISLPIASQSNLPPPPIPRNPEKDALLSTLSQSLTQNLHNKLTQNTSAIPSLHAQHTALATAHATLDSELTQLATLSSTLQSNISVLQSSLHQADRAIGAAGERASKGDIPNVDEMLTAPTVVGKQLYDVVCEERGIEAAIFALQEGLVRGRVGTDVWARKTRELAREGFRRRWLGEKVGRGMGLEVRSP